MRIVHVGIAIILGLLSLGDAQAQRVLIHAQTRSAYGEQGAQWVGSADLHSGALLPGTRFLPGNKAASPLLCSGDGKRAFLATIQETAPPFAWITVFQTLPYHPIQCIDGASHSLTAPVLHALYEMPGAPLELVLADHNAEGDPVLRAVPWEDSAGSLQEAVESWDLPGSLLRILPVPDKDYLIVLCRSSEDYVDGYILERYTQHRYPITDLLPIPNTPENYLVDLALSADGNHLFCLTTGINKISKHRGIFTQLHVLDLETLKPATEAVQWEEQARRHPSALLPSAEGGCWAVSFSPDADTPTALYARRKDDAWKIIRRNPLFDVEGDFLLAAAPVGRDVAMITANQLEIWTDGKRQGVVASYAASLQWLNWTVQGLLAGEQNRLHRVDPATGRSVAAVELPYGEVVHAIPLPESLVPQPDADGDGLTPEAEAKQDTADDDPDADGDGLHDGIDPYPISAHPVPDMPALVQLRGEAAGQEIRSFRIGRSDDAARWRIQYDQAHMPWLRIFPLTGDSGGIVRLGIDPALYPPGTHYQEALEIELLSTQPGYQHIRRRTRLPLLVATAAQDKARLLWIWGDAGEAGFRSQDVSHPLAELASLLAGAPGYCSHHEKISPTDEPLSSYALVVLSATTAAQGGVVRQALLEYLAQGGALLLLGEVLDAEAYRSLEQWLAPAGILLHTDRPATSTASLAGELDPYWEAVAIQAGCSMQQIDAGGVVSDAAFIARPYGKGRVAVLSSAQPLENRQLNNQVNRRFARALFRWLLRAGIDVADLDGDGLPDSVEDVNGNNAWDAGETDLLHPDTDRDGLPDGMEDRNYNGQVDLGESDPRQP